MSCYFVKLVIPYRNEVCAILLHISIIILAYYDDGEVEGKRKLFCANIRNESNALELDLFSFLPMLEYIDQIKAYKLLRNTI